VRWLEFLLATGGLVPVALWLWVNLRLRSRVLDLALLVVLFLALAMGVALAVGVCGQLNPHALAAAGACCAAAGTLALRGRLGEAAGAFRMPRPADPVLRVVLVLAGGAAAWHLLRFYIHVFGLAPYVHDCLCYHLPRVAEWVQNGRIFAPDLPAARSYFAANFELLQAWCAVFPHHDVVIEAAGLPFFAVSVLSVYSMARSVGLSAAASVAAAIAASFAPGFLMSTTCGKNDIAVTSLLLFGFAVVLATPRDEPSRGLAVLGLVAGMGIGAKATFAIVLPGLALLAVHKWFCRGRNSGTPVPKSPPLVPCVLVAAVAVLLASYWYLRNWAATGNPMYPSGFAVAGHTVFQPLNRSMQQGGFSLESGWMTVSDLFANRLYDGRWPVNPELWSQAGWGWFAVAIGIPATIFALFHSGTLRRLFLAAACSFLCLAASVTPDPWTMRFFTWVPPVLAVGAMAGMQAVRSQALRRSMVLVSFAAVALDVIESAGNGYAEPRTLARQFARPWRSRVPNVGNVSLSRHVPKGEPVACFAEETDAVYHLYGPDFSRRVVYICKPPHSKDFAHEMELRGVRFLYLAGSGQRVTKLIADELKGGRLRHVKGELYERTEP
jgi:hypothetical protein